MRALTIAVGTLLVCVALVDLAWTTVAAGSGAGPLTARAARRLWHLALSLHARWLCHAGLSAAGVAIVFAVLAMWIALLLTGWSLVFASSTGAVREPDGSPADGIARVYFAGYSVFSCEPTACRP